MAALASGQIGQNVVPLVVKVSRRDLEHAPIPYQKVLESHAKEI